MRTFLEFIQDATDQNLTIEMTKLLRQIERLLDQDSMQMGRDGSRMTNRDIIEKGVQSIKDSKKRLAIGWKIRNDLPQAHPWQMIYSVTKEIYDVPEVGSAIESTVQLGQIWNKLLSMPEQFGKKGVEGLGKEKIKQEYPRDDDALTGEMISQVKHIQALLEKPLWPGGTVSSQDSIIEKFGVPLVGLFRELPRAFTWREIYRIAKEIIDVPGVSEKMKDNRILYDAWNKLLMMPAKAAQNYGKILTYSPPPTPLRAQAGLGRL